MNYSGSTYITEERIKLAGDEKKDRLYEPKQNQKAIKVLTVAAYVLCVSLAAIMLSFYYIFIWNSSTKPNLSQPRAVTCDKIVMPDGLEKLLANASEISLETFLKNYSMLFKLDPNKLIEIEVKHLRPQLTEPLKQQQATIANNNNSNNNINNENSVDYYLASATLTPSKTGPESASTETTTELSDSSLFLSDLPVVPSLSSSPSGLLIKKLKEINQSNRKDKANNKKNLEIDEGGYGEDENGDNDDNDDDNDDDDEDDDTEQEDYYEPSGQKEITDKFINNNKTAKNFNQ